MRRISQKDPRWSRLKLGNSSVMMGGYGCLVAAIVMGHSKFYPKAGLMPDEVVKTWKFTDDNYKYGGGLLLWEATDFDGMEFYDRVRKWNNGEAKKVKELCQNPFYFVVLELLTRSGGRHWVTAIGKSVLGWATNNPWTGERLWKTVGFMAPYPRILGYSVFIKS